MKQLNIQLVKQFINNFDFNSPDFRRVPEGFSSISSKDLTKEEKHLLEAITTIWIMQQPNLASCVSSYFRCNKILNGSGRMVFNTSMITTIIFFIISALYYVNINYNLGLNFLTEFFA